MPVCVSDCLVVLGMSADLILSKGASHPQSVAHTDRTLLTQAASSQFGDIEQSKRELALHVWEGTGVVVSEEFELFKNDVTAIGMP